MYYSPPDREVLFEYNLSRGRKGTAEFFKDFSGAVQTDGWPVYKHFTSQESMTALSCMAQARRYFEAIKTYPEKREEILLLIAELYELEALAKEEELSSIQIYELRQEKG